MLSLAKLVADESLGLKVVTAGADSSFDVEVLWLHNTELPDPSSYIRQSELVLTNGLWQGAVSAADFVDAVVRARASGIMFGLTVQTHAVPTELIEACLGVGLPLVTVPVDVPFTAVTQAAARLQNEARLNTLMGTVRRGDVLASVISHGGGISGVLGVLQREHDLPLAVVDRGGRLLSQDGEELGSGFLRACADALTRRPPPLEIRPPGRSPASVFLVEGAIGEIDAGLFCLKPLRELSGEEQKALDQTARFLSLEVAKLQAIHAIEMRFSGELLEMILSGAGRSTELHERLRAFGIDSSAPMAVLAVALSNNTSIPAPVVGDVEAHFRARGIASVTAAGSQDAVIIFPWSGGSGALKELAADLSVVATAPGDDVRAVVGIGEVAEDVGRLKEQLVRAREACRVLCRRPAGPSSATFNEMGTHTMLLGLHDDVILRQFADDELGPLRDHDKQKGTDLELTLRTFLARDGHWGVTAADMFIHVNTLRNRIARISELTGRNLNRFEDRVNLFLALEADAMS